MAQTDYNAIMDQTIKKLWEYLEDDKDWKHLKTSGDLVVHQKQSDVFDGILYKIERTMNVSPQRNIDLSFDWKFMETADKDAKGIELIERIGGPDNLHIVRTVSDSAMFGLISAREFITMPGVRHYPEKSLRVLAHVSVDHPKCPEDKKFVRGVVYPSGRFVYEIAGQPNKCRLVEFSQNDPKLSVPKMIAEQAAAGIIKSKIDYFNKALEKLDATKK
ncbi:stAR-related lipid transfer protein 6-like [Ptychodera flava]|uniref:stAR-related lipid transfer protein 6-like n=1 Tax=Ptychodera flava TaxID=63121 RepID=UPI00396A050C